MTGNSKWITVLFLAGSIIFCASGWAETPKNAPGPADGDSGSLAVIDGKPVTIDIFRAEMVRRGGEYDATRKEELLDSIVRSELLFAAARNEKYENDPEVIAQVKQVMVGKYLHDNLEPNLARLKATEQEAEAYYYAHPAEFGSHAMVHAALIRIAVSPKASGEKRAELLRRAERVRAEALALEPGVPAFGSVAVKFSEEQESRYRGGDIGWLQTGEMDGRWDRKVSDAIFALKAPGQVSPVIAAADGYYILKLMETKGATVKPFADVKEGVRYIVLQEKRKKVEQEFMEELKKRIAVTVNSGLLQTIALPGEGKKGAPPALPSR
jgi:parvulin-like peptidyl-prolyl isomerase